ncbi:MAG: alpha/beta hydrolase [Pseudomonadota bacterium]
MFMNRTRLFLLGSAVVLLASCSGNSETSTETAATAPAPAATPAAAPAAPAPAPIVIPPVSIEVTQSDVAKIPADIATKLKEIGAKNDIPGTSALFAPAFPAGFMDTLNVTRNLTYGPAERNVMDIAAPKDGPGNRPVIIFVHGGGFGGGNKSAENSPFYDNIPYWIASQGLVGVNINYRYAPASQWPSGVEDLNLLMDWVKANINQYGGDPGRIFFWGKSTGASHVADYLADRVKQGKPSEVLGAIFTSGSYALGDTPLWANYYGDDVSKYPERNALPNLINTDAKILATYAEFDGDQYKQQFVFLVNAMTEAGKPLETLYLQNHSHMSETYAVGSPDVSLTDPVLDFVLRTSGEK